jgi:probable F420-dependent oxidoreductase
MKLGLMFVNSGPLSSPDLFAHLAITAERCGFESIWSVEHVVIPGNYQSPYPYSKTGKIPGGEDVPISDPLLPLAYAAAVTKTLRLGTGVIILPQRHPLYLAKEMATLDVLSRGRAILGIGSGWLKEEFDALGLDFHTRGARTDESIAAMRVLWREASASFHGKHFNFTAVKSFPKPVQKDGVPIVVGGHSTAAARRAGRLGDGFFPALGDPDKLKELFALMRSEAEKAGRNPNRIELSCMGRANPDTLKALQDLGVSRVVIPPPGYDTEAITRGLEKIANEVITKL